MKKLTLPVFFERLEGLAVFITALLVYTHLSFPWPLFFLLLLVPDVSIAGYAINARIGAVLYNIAHSHVLPLPLLLLSWVLESAVGMELMLIWTAHIGMDRFFGFGLKHMSDFRETHLGRIGRD
jgi:hypothetical protein